MRLLLLDNYDSFTYNLYDYIRVSESELSVDVLRNDKITVQEASGYDIFVLSPGPGLPAQAGILMPLLAEISRVKPVLGVCLGLQAIAEHFGGRLHNLDKVYHGIAREIKVLDREDILYQGLPGRFDVGRYHSWVADPKTLPNDLIVTAVDANQQIMSLRHKVYPCFGVQYHPESILTTNGQEIITNFLKYAKGFYREK
jgi:anthranilate synthase component 2